jgi:hypothetical protein
LFRNGSRKGQPKRAITCEQFYENTIRSLEQRGLIRFVDKALGTGYVAVAVGRPIEWRNKTNARWQRCDRRQTS